ncbi:MAG: hypothetical protein WBQ89_06415, partial [Candidatus Acidiferrum sp.]
MTAFSSKWMAVSTIWLALAMVFALVAEARPEALFSLRGATLEAFGRYVVKTDAQNAQSLRQGPFLWVDGLPQKVRTTAIDKLKGGEVEMRRLSVNAAGENLDVSGGMIHD